VSKSSRDRPGPARELLALQAEVLEHLPEVVYVRGPDRQLLYVNPAGERLIGRSLDEALSLPCYRVFGDPGGHCHGNCPIDRAIETGEPLSHLEGVIEAKDGKAVQVEVTAAPVADPNSQVAAIVILRDLTQLRDLEMTQIKALVTAEKANRALEASEARFRDFARLSCDWLWESDEAHRITYITGETVDEERRFLGQRRENFVDTKTDPERWRPFFESLEKRQPIVDFVYPMTGANGQSIWVRISGKPLFDDNGKFVGYRGIGHEITRAVEEKEQLYSRAMRDHLTKLPNRRTFDETLHSWLARHARGGRGFAMAFIDLDDFKEINDNSGHVAGDQVLTIASERLIACLREEDHVARLGGDEFAVLLAGVDNVAQATVIAAKMNERLAEPMHLSNDRIVTTSASVGLAICPTHGREASALVQAADHAMYRAKECGKGQFRIAKMEPEPSVDLELTP